MVNYEGCTNMIGKIIIWLYIHVFGVKFYKLARIPDVKEYRNAVCVLLDEKTITFRFYRFTHGVYIYLNSRTMRRYTTALLIRASYEGTFNDDIKKYDDLVFYFPGILSRLYKERIVSELMVSAYLDYIKTHMYVKDSANSLL